MLRVKWKKTGEAMLAVLRLCFSIICWQIEDKSGQRNKESQLRKTLGCQVEKRISVQ